MDSIFSRSFAILASPKSQDAATAGVFLAPVVGALERFIFGDITFLWFLLLLVSIDTVLGFRVAWREKRVSSVAFSRVLDKLLVYLALMAAAFAVSKLGGTGTESLLFFGIRWLILSYISVREFISIAEKAGRLGYGLPDWMMKHLKDYAAKGPNSLKDKQDTPAEKDNPDKTG